MNRASFFTDLDSSRRILVGIIFISNNFKKFWFYSLFNFLNFITSRYPLTPKIIKYVLLLFHDFLSVAVYCLRSDFSMFK